MNVRYFFTSFNLHVAGYQYNGTCVNTDNGATNKNGYGCIYMVKSECGQFGEDEDFDSVQMCGICKDGNFK